MHNIDEKRFEFGSGNDLAVCEYRTVQSGLELYHTYVPERFRGQGIAAKLAEEALNYAKLENIKVVPTCSYIAVYIERHPEYRGLLVETN